VRSVFQRTWRLSTACPTKAAARELLREWKTEREEAGWRVFGSLTAGMCVACRPGAPDDAWQVDYRRTVAGEPPLWYEAASVGVYEAPASR
jgi:hypothetical protein